MKIEIKNRYLKFILKVIYGFRVVIIFFIFGYTFFYFAYKNAVTTCAKFKEYSSIRGGGVVLFEFEIRNKKYTSTMGIGFFKRDKLSSMEYCDCIELEYNSYFPSIASRVIDKRFIKYELVGNVLTLLT